MQNPFDLGPEGSPTEPTSDDKLWSLLSYLTSGLVGLIMLVSDKAKQSEFVRHHAITSLGLLVTWIAAWIIVAILSLIPGVACIAWIIFLVPAGLYIYYAIEAYQGKTVEVPYLSEFMRKQGWL